MSDLVNRALKAKRESKYIEFKAGFDPAMPGEWCEIIKDVVALANSGGGILVFGLDSYGTPTGHCLDAICKIDPADIANKINEMVRRPDQPRSGMILGHQEDHRMNTAAIASIGIDLGKTTFHLVALDCHAGVIVRKKFSRLQLLAFTANLPWSLIGMEACSGAHFLAARLRDQGHEVKLIPAQFVKPYRKSNKNDFIDAEAIAEAVTRRNMRFVPIKTDDQLDLQALHRVRERLVRRRTALINQIRGFLLERGLVFAKRPANLRRQMPLVLEDAETNLTPRLRRLLNHLWQEWKQVQADIAALDQEMEQTCITDESCRRLREIPGVGPLVATAIVAAIGNGAAFGNGREFAAWLGLAPKQYSTGGRTRLFGISKRGNAYLRRMFIHGARAVLWRVKYDTGALREWTNQLQLRAAKNVVAVALANKLARIAWAVLSSGEHYRTKPAAIAA